MRHVLIGLGLFAMTAGGCATSTQLERDARQHDLRADAASQMRDYDRAAKEKEEAERLHRKAVKKAYKEGAAETVIVPTTPSVVPHEPPAAPPVSTPTPPASETP